MKNKELEYSIIHETIRHQLDYRLKIFNFGLAFNVFLMTVVFEYFKASYYKIGGVILGIVATIAFMLLEQRAVDVAKHYVNYGKKVEDELGLGIINEVIIKSLRSSKIRYRYFFRILYFLIITLWILGLIFICKNM